jgi:O-methyltransferase
VKMSLELRRYFKLFVARRHFMLVRYANSHRSKWMDEVTHIADERDLLLNHCEACQLISAIEATRKVPGDLAEVGVASGASAKLIANHADGRALHLFDTFEGLPDTGPLDSAKFTAGQFRYSLENVRNYVGSSNIHYHRGLFPATAEPVKDRRFSFVHLDVDLYSSTLAGLNFFYPRLSPGGILISHDYLTADGVNSAFDEFFKDKAEPVIELSGYQCMVVKLSSVI